MSCSSSAVGRYGSTCDLRGKVSRGRSLQRELTAEIENEHNANWTEHDVKKRTSSIQLIMYSTSLRSSPISELLSVKVPSRCCHATSALSMTELKSALQPLLERTVFATLKAGSTTFGSMHRPTVQPSDERNPTSLLSSLRGRAHSVSTYGSPAALNKGVSHERQARAHNAPASQWSKRDERQRKSVHSNKRRHVVGWSAHPHPA